MFEQKDLTNAENLLRALKKGKFELDGEEILAFAEMMKWSASLIIKIKQDLLQQAEKKKIMSAAVEAKTSPNTTKPKVKKGTE